MNARVGPRSPGVRAVRAAPVPENIEGELRTLRHNDWPLSIGGSAKGSSAKGNPNGVPGDPSCFRPGASFNLTGQMRYAKQYGEAAARKASQLFGGGR